MNRSKELVSRILEAEELPDSPEDFDVKTFLTSPVEHFAKSNGFTRIDRNDREERWVKELADGETSAWLVRDRYSENEPHPAPDNIQWRFVTAKVTRDCGYCHGTGKGNYLNPHVKTACPDCKGTGKLKTPRYVKTTQAVANEQSMSYLLSAISQRLATWPKKFPKPGTQDWKKIMAKRKQ